MIRSILVILASIAVGGIIGFALMGIAITRDDTVKSRPYTPPTPTFTLCESPL